MKYAIVTPWHDPEQRFAFIEEWGIREIPDWLVFQQDKDKSGCAVTKNRGINEAIDRGAEIIICLDDDCMPAQKGMILEKFAYDHVKAFDPQPVKMYEEITDPPSRGTPYFNHHVIMPVAAVMGFWTGIPDYDAPSQLVRAFSKQMTFKRKAMFGRFFPFSGMNCSFRADWWPHFSFVETAPRYDDIFMGYRLQAKAYKEGYCINLNGPIVRHVRQSNIWQNLKDESVNMERNETEWVQYVQYNRGCPS